MTNLHKLVKSSLFFQAVHLVALIGLLTLISVTQSFFSQAGSTSNQQSQDTYWLLLHRLSNKEFLYKGLPGDPDKSMLVRTFSVKTGIPGERPTPLPHLLGKDYWVIIDEQDQKDNPETAPYFLTLDVPVSEQEPFGPTPYEECDGQCNWVLPGAFGLHGSGGDITKLADENPGSSGCIRHTDKDIAYLYNILDPKKEEVRYYIKDI